MESLQNWRFCSTLFEGHSSRSTGVNALHACGLSPRLPGQCRTQSLKGREVFRKRYHLPSSRSKILRVGSLHGAVFGVRLSLDRYRQASSITGSKSNVISATAAPIDLNEESVETAPVDSSKSFVEAGAAWLDAFYRFSRPHTVIGSAIGVISVSLLALQSPADFSSKFLIGLAQALVPALFMNIYIVGLNQIYDVDIDKVNKPYLPLASGDFSMTTGVTVVLASAILSLALGMMVGSRPLMWALTVSLILGTAYSIDIPLLRWKRSALVAASCILAVRAVVVQLGFFMHMQEFVFRRVAIMTKPLLFATGFMCFFSVVIALAKDIPDVEGDKRYGIQSFSVRLGQKKIFWLCVWLLEVAYGMAILAGALSPVVWSKAAMIVGHAALVGWLYQTAKAVDMKTKSSITAFYMFIWKGVGFIKAERLLEAMHSDLQSCQESLQLLHSCSIISTLFYAEYLIIPFIRL